MSRINAVYDDKESLCRPIKGPTCIVALAALAMMSACTVVAPESKSRFDKQVVAFTGKEDFLNYRVDEFGNTFIAGTFKRQGQETRGDQLEFLEVGFPKDFANGKLKRALEDIRKGKTDYRRDTDKIEIIFYVKGSQWGGQCHEPAGDYHCH